MRFRKLRIAWSVVWGLLAVLLIVLWVRSYWHRETFARVDANGISVCSITNGGLILERISGSVVGGIKTWGAQWRWTEDDDILGPQLTTKTGIPVGIRTTFVQFWQLVLLCTVFTVLPSRPWWSNQFSLRTLLIATTLVAVVLGLIVWLHIG
jgi:hypothetical protein